MPEEIIDKYREPIEGDPKAMEEVLPAPEKESEQTEKVPMQDRNPDFENVGEKIPEQKEKAVFQEKQEAPDQKKQQAVETKLAPKQDDDKKSSGNPKTEAHRISQLKQQDQVKALCDLAFQEGIDLAIQVVEEINSPYLTDEFHDTLVDDFKEKINKQLE